MEGTSLLQQVLDCSIDDAIHYLRIFNGDSERAVTVVLENRENQTWWGHPWNRTEGSDELTGYQEEHKKFASIQSRSEALSSTVTEQKEEILYAEDDAGAGSKYCYGSDEEKNNFDDTSTNDLFRSQSFDAIPREGLSDDSHFYERYQDMVNDFVDAVCSAHTTKNDLRKKISEADTIVARDTGSELPQSNIVNRPSFKDNVYEGRTPLSYAVAKNLVKRLDHLIDLGADVSKIMESGVSTSTALTIAATNSKRDGTEMVRILLSKGANPDEISMCGVEEKALGLGMRYWLDKARRVGVPNKSKLAHLKSTPPMDRLHELDYAVVGEEAAVSVIQEALAGRFGNPQGNRKPLVMLLLGPPGHGKTYFSSNAARSLVGEENFLFIPCQSIRDDADLFGSRLGGARNGSYSSDGQLTHWLRQRQRRKCIVFLDEFEKMQELTSALGWGQAKKIYQSFLEPWNDGTLSDQGASSGTNGHADQVAAGGDKIDCSQCIWIMTSNWGQREIIDFCEKNKSRMQKKIDHKDVAWIQNDLVKKVLRPLCIREFGSVHEDVKALCRRIDCIVPFLPFTPKETKVVADTALTERFSLYREPCVLEGPEDKRRSFGNLRLHSTKAFASYASSLYDPMQGASGMLSVVQLADGKFQMMNLRDQLGLTPEQEARITHPKPPPRESVEPEFWIHYDEGTAEIGITQSKPLDDEISDDEMEKSKIPEDCVVEEDLCEQDRPTKRSAHAGASNDAF